MHDREPGSNGKIAVELSGLNILVRAVDRTLGLQLQLQSNRSQSHLPLAFRCSPSIQPMGALQLLLR